MHFTLSIKDTYFLLRVNVCGGQCLEIFAYTAVGMVLGGRSEDQPPFQMLPRQ